MVLSAEGGETSLTLINKDGRRQVVRPKKRADHRFARRFPARTETSEMAIFRQLRDLAGTNAIQNLPEFCRLDIRDIHTVNFPDPRN